MKIEKFLYEADCQLSKKLEEDLASNQYSKNDANIASVLTRIDTGVILCALVYNTKLLSSIKLGIWGIFVILLTNLIIKLLK